MAKRHLNWKPTVFVLTCLVVLVLIVIGLRELQHNRLVYAAREAGLKAYENRMWESAANNLGRYLRFDATDMGILLKYAEAQLNVRPVKRNNAQSAVAAYRNALRIDGTNVEAAKRLVDLYLQIDIATEAELIAERYLQENNDPEIRTLLAKSLARQRKFEEAATQLEAIIEAYPQQIPAYETLGQLKEQYPEDFPGTAEHWFNKAVENNRTSAQALAARAAFCLRNNKISEAAADLEKAERLDLSDPTIQLRLAAEFSKAGLFSKARTHLAQVRAKDPASQALWQTWARVAINSKSPEEMLDVAQGGLRELSFQPWDFMPAAAELYIRCGEFDRAKDCIDKLKQKGVRPGTVALLEGLLAGAREQNYEAIRCLKRAMEMGNTSEHVQLELAAALSRAGDVQSAVLQLRKLTSKRPDSLRARLGLAKLLYRRGKWAEAAEQARLASQIAPNNLEAALMHIRARMRLMENREVHENTEAWQELEKRLAELERLTSGALEVRLLQLGLAIQRREFSKAEQLVAGLKNDENAGIDVAMAEVDLFLAQDKVSEAVELLYNVGGRFPQKVLPVRYLATIFAERGEETDCEKVLQDAIRRINSPTAKRELGLLLGYFYRRLGQNDKSHNLLRTLSGELPYEIPIKRQLIRHMQVEEDLSRAQQLVNDIKAIEGEDGWQWRLEQASVWFGQADFESRYPHIITLLKENLVTNQDDQISCILLAATYEKANKLRLAATTYYEALERSPADIGIITSAVATMYKVGEYEQADEIVGRALKQKVVGPEVSRLQLQCCLRKGELGPAETILADLTAKQPDDATLSLSLALVKMWQNKYDRARELLNRLRVEQRDSLAVNAALVELNIRQQKGQEALALCDEIVKCRGDASSRILRGKTYLMLGQTKNAKKEFEQILSTEPNNVQAWISRSDSNWSMGQFGEAIKDLRKALALEPGDVHIQKRIIGLLLLSGKQAQIGQARELLDRALSLNAQDVDLRLYKVRTLLAKGTAPAIHEAESILQEITQEKPKLVKAWATLAQIYLKQEQFSKAMDTVLRGLTYSPDDKTLLLLKAQTEATRAPALAIPTLYVLNEREPNDTEIGLRLANTYMAAGQCEKSITLLKKLLGNSGKKDRSKIDIALAVALYKAGHKKEAKKKFEAFYESAPHDAEVFLAQAGLLKDERNWDALTNGIDDRFRCNHDDMDAFVTLAGHLAAMRDDSAEKIAEDLLRKILDCDPNYLPALRAFATLLHVNGRAVESAKVYRHILRFEPDAVVAMNNLAWILCEEESKYQQALELAQQGLKKTPDYVDLIDTRGVIYCRLGEYSRAVKDFERCVKLSSRNSPSLTAAYFHMARTLVNMGQKNRAVDSLRRALDLFDKIGGLSHDEIREAKSLHDELSQEESHVPITN